MLTPEMHNQLQALQRGMNICSSDRPSDRARTKMKKLGLITFDRKMWLWRITDDGRAALIAEERGTKS